MPSTLSLDATFDYSRFRSRCPSDIAPQERMRVTSAEARNVATALVTRKRLTPQERRRDRKNRGA